MSSLKKNFSYLFLGQLFNQILPLLVIPYLVKILSIEYYGVYAYILALIALSAIFIDFGFGIFGVERIVKCRGNAKKIFSVYSNISSLKILLCVFSIAIYFLYVSNTSDYSAFKAEMFMGVFSMLAIAIQPFWLCAGVEKNHITVFSIFFGKILFLLLVFFGVDGDSDAVYLVFFFGLSNLVSSLIGIFLLKRVYFFKALGVFRIKKSYIKKSWPFFKSRVAVAMYTIAGSVFLGVFSTPASVAIYSVAEQMYRGIQGLVSPISQVMYPYMLRTKNYKVFYKVTLISFFLNLFGCLFAYGVSYYFINYFFGAEYLGATEVFRVFLLSLMIVVPSFLFGYPLFGARNLLYRANDSVVYGAITQIGILFLLFSFDKIHPVNVAISVLITEFIVFSLRFKWGFWDFYKR